MAKWTSYFKIVTPKPLEAMMTDSQFIGDQSAYGNYTWYQRLIQGSASRISRYREYNLMDQDIDVNRALDVIAEEITGNNPKGKEPIVIEAESDDDLDGKILTTLKSALNRWVQIHEWNTKIFKIARTMVKYGDVFFKRRGTFEKWEYILPQNVVAAIVDENDFTEVLGWQLRLDTKRPGGAYGQSYYYKKGPENLDTVKSEKIIRFSINDDMADSAPFGESILKPVYKTYKQKELLEDAILIYRIQRAPERRVFYVDVGRMPPNRVKQYLEGIKNEIKQKKVPNNLTSQGLELDSVYNPQCLALNTKIPLLDGRTLTLTKIIKEYEEGKTNWAYSINPETGEVVPGIISWAGTTRKNAETVKITLDNGKSFICTPDHKIPVRGKGFIEAKDLTEEDSLFPYTTKNSVLENKKKYEYQQVFNPETNQFVFTHRLIANHMRNINSHSEFVFMEGYQDKDKQTIHHKDFNRFNNNPENLTFMNSQDHILYHQSLGNKAFTDYIGNLSDEERKEHFIKANNARIDRLNNDPEFREKMASISLKNLTHTFENQTLTFNGKLFEYLYRLIYTNPDISFKAALSLLNTSTEFLGLFAAANKLHIENTDNTVGLYKINTKAFSEKAFKKLILFGGYKHFRDLRDKIVREKISKISNDKINTIKTHSHIVLGEIIEAIKSISSISHNLVTYYKNNKGEWNAFSQRINSIIDKKLTSPNTTTFDRLASFLGFENFKKLTYGLANINHKIVKIEKWHSQDTGTITIDGNEKYHNYHTFAIDSGIYVKNSQGEDFFFASRPDGRGSKVEVLPAGQALGELSDLEYFYDKIYRGLRIPASYMKQGAEGALFNDGKVGVAYIQELRFSLFVERLQGYIENILDTEFKKFLRTMGIQVDEALYQLRLPEPSNFGVYRQQEVDAALLGTYSGADAIAYLSKRFILTKYLQFTEDEIVENEEMLAEEKGIEYDEDNPEASWPTLYGPSAEEAGLGGMGVPMGGDLGMTAGALPGEEVPGGAGAAGAAGGAAPVGGAPPAGA